VAVALIVTGAVAILAAAAVNLIRWVRGTEEPAVHHGCCPGCGQKVRYAARRAGREAPCPRCGLWWTLPSTSQPLHATG
jgi:uncharacterized paraquat-inducible protein A